MSRIDKAHLITFFQASLGQTKAEEVLEQAAAELGINLDDMSRDTALGVLDAITKQPGIVGVVARFAKTKLLLRSGERKSST